MRMYIKTRADMYRCADEGLKEKLESLGIQSSLEETEIFNFNFYLDCVVAVNTVMDTNKCEIRFSIEDSVIVHIPFEEMEALMQNDADVKVIDKRVQ